MAQWTDGRECGFLALLQFWVAVMMWQKMSNKGGLGEEESKAFKEVKQRMEESR